MKIEIAHNPCNLHKAYDYKALKAATKIWV